MSKKTKSEQRKGRNSLPLFAIIAGGVVLIFAALLIAVGRPDKEDAGASGAPSVAVDQEMIDFGDVKLDTPLTFSIKVTNTGGGTLRFREKPYIEVVEGC